MDRVKNFILRSLDFFAGCFTKILVLYLALFFTALGISYVGGYRRYPLLAKIVAANDVIQNPVTDFLRRNVPTDFHGTDAARWMFAVGMFTLLALCEVYRERLRGQKSILERRKHLAQQDKEALEARKAREAERKEAIAALEEEAKRRNEADARARAEQEALYRVQREAIAKAQEEAAKKAAQAREAREMAASGAEDEAGNGASGGHKDSHGTTREELLELLAQTKKSLDSQKQNVAFLAIDVANSTGMKIGEEPAIAERDFHQYKKLVQKAIADNRGLKAAWTPDGVMICFKTVPNAIGAAQQVIRDLDHFNKKIKAVKMDFKVRCGINSGSVLYDESVPMEEMSDRAIDITGHLQKYAGENTIFIGAHALEGLKAAGDFKPVAKEIDGVKVCQWPPSQG